MNRYQLAVAALLAAAFSFYAPVSLAGDNVATMAGIVLELQHFPSDDAKASLAAIVNGEASDAEKTVAMAIAGIEHKVSDGDRAALAAIAADESQAAALRKLAGIVAGINHVPGAEAKAALQELAGG